MRHFSQVSNSNVFSSYDVNFGEYVASKASVLPSFLVALARAMECKLPAVKKAFGNLLEFSEKELRSESMPYEPWADEFSPNENRVLIDAALFYRQVEEGGLGAQGAKTHVFTYCNLNEGRSVTWIHFVG